MPGRDDARSRLESALPPAAIVARGEELTLHPFSEEEISAAVWICRETRTPLAPVGGDTHVEVGGPVPPQAVRLSLSRLNGLVEHDDANLTVSAQAGMTVAALQSVLRSRDQFAVLETARPERATVGGVVASNINGYRRTAYRSIRDLVIGMRLVTGNGEIVKAGGKVVKNVAGYDMCKLFVGSLGTLGVITGITARVEPAPEAEATFLLGGGGQGPGANGAVAIAGAMADPPLLPTAVALLNRAAARRVSAGEYATVLVRMEGFPAVIERGAREIRARAGGEPRRLEGPAHTSVWDRLGALGWEGPEGLIRVILPRDELADAWVALDRAVGSAEMAADLLSGTIWVIPRVEAFAAVVETLASTAERSGGHLLIARLPTGFAPLPAAQRWRPVPASLPLMAGLKHAFDRDGILNPGRFLV
jgi:glycolate oxidase FAD binding subunit